MTGGAAFTEPGIHYLRGAWQLGRRGTRARRRCRRAATGTCCSTAAPELARPSQPERLAHRPRIAAPRRPLPPDPADARSRRPRTGSTPRGARSASSSCAGCSPSDRPRLPGCAVRCREVARNSDARRGRRHRAGGGASRSTRLPRPIARRRPNRYLLDPEAIVARALGDDDRERTRRPTTGAPDSSGISSRPRRTVRLNALGARMVARHAPSAGCARVARWATPGGESVDRARAPVAPPIVIIGGWRTGTTFLFRLLADGPAAARAAPGRALRAVALRGPRRRRARSGARRRRRRARDAARAQPARWPSCTTPARACPRSACSRWAPTSATGASARRRGSTPTAAWLAGEDPAGLRATAASCELLQTLDERRRSSSRRRRTPPSCRTSPRPSRARASCSCTATSSRRSRPARASSRRSARRTATPSTPRDVGRFQTEQTELWLDRALAFREGDVAHRKAARFVDLDYRALVADPLAAVRRIYDAAELDLTPDVVEHLRAPPRRTPTARARCASLHAGAFRARSRLTARAVRAL